MESIKSTTSTSALKLYTVGAESHRINEALEQLCFDHHVEKMSKCEHVSLAALQDFSSELKEMLESNMTIPVVIADQASAVELSNLFESDYWTTAYIDKTITNRRNDYSIHIGVQGHFYNNHTHEPHRVVRLSEVRYNHSKAEVALRNVDTVALSLDAIRASDIPGNKSSWPTGMTAEEACQIAQYAGAGTNLRGVLIHDYNPADDAHGHIAQSIALMLWHLSNGYQIRQEELRHNEVNTYMVFANDLDQEIVFTEHKRSGRWWIKVEDEAADAEPVTIPCTQEDYEAVCANDIPDKIARLYSAL